MANKVPIARLFERVGSELGTSSWITLDQARIDEFARCTGDHQWIHVDAARAARETPIGSTIAHGYLTLSLLAPSTFAILVDNVTVCQALTYGLEKVRFVAPVRAGKRVRNRIRLTDLEHKGGGRFLATTENTIEIEAEAKPALVATALALLME